jgi:type IV secretory pathway VirB10-like protein
MNSYHDHKVVVLKKSLLIAVVLGALLIIALVINNIFNATRHENFLKENTSQPHSLATPADTMWYQTREIQQPYLANNKAVVTKTASKEVQVYSTTKTVTSAQPQPEMMKAMGAAITSNQLIGTNQGDSSLTSSTNEIVNTSHSSAGSDQNMQQEKKEFLQASSQLLDSDYLSSSLKNPISPYELKADSIIPGELITGINSDLPGQITGQVRSNVYDSISGKYLLIPQGSKLVGLYDSQVTYGQDGVLVVWKRIIFPNGKSINLEGMPGVDLSGYSGFRDQVDNHYINIFGSVLLMSTLSAGAQLSQPQNSNNPFAAPTVGQTLAQSLGTNISNTGTTITSKNLNVQPSIKIRQGYLFNIKVTKDMVFPSSYGG